MAVTKRKHPSESSSSKDALTNKKRRTPASEKTKLYKITYGPWKGDTLEDAFQNGGGPFVEECLLGPYAHG
jgi:hypothetical protein